jgi:hypothetical protein
VLRAFDDAFSDVPTESSALKERQRLRQKIAEANMMGPRQAVFAFLEGLGIGFNAYEKRIFDSCRNAILHTGHKDDESEIKILRRNDIYAATMANLFHRALLSVLGYEGEYMEAYNHRSFPLEHALEYESTD